MISIKRGLCLRQFRETLYGRAVTLSKQIFVRQERAVRGSVELFRKKLFIACGARFVKRL